jgi:hypothetical protein
MIIMLVVAVILVSALCDIVAAVLPVLIALAVPPAERPALARLIAANGGGGVRRALTIAAHRFAAGRHRP